MYPFSNWVQSTKVGTKRHSAGKIVSISLMKGETETNIMPLWFNNGV